MTGTGRGGGRGCTRCIGIRYGYRTCTTHVYNQVDTTTHTYTQQEEHTIVTAVVSGSAYGKVD